MTMLFASAFGHLIGFLIGFATHFFTCDRPTNRMLCRAGFCEFDGDGGAQRATENEDAIDSWAISNRLITVLCWSHFLPPPVGTQYT